MQIFQKLLILLIVVVGLSSCGSTFVEEIHLNKNGSGKYEFTMDLSPLMTSLKGLGKTIGADSTKQQKLDKVTKLAKDTSFTAYGIIPDSLHHFISKPELLKKLNISVKSNEEEETFITRIMMDYDNIANVSDAFKEFATVIAKSENSDPSFEKIQNALRKMTSAGWRWRKGNLTRAARSLNNDMTNELKGDEKKQAMAMAKMILAGTSHKLIIHLPKKVKSVSYDNAIIKGNTVTIETPILDMLEQKEVPELKIKYKKWLLW